MVCISVVIPVNDTTMDTYLCRYTVCCVKLALKRPVPDVCYMHPSLQRSLTFINLGNIDHLKHQVCLRGLTTNLEVGYITRHYADQPSTPVVSQEAGGL